jgi:hypothetical protein
MGSEVHYTRAPRGANGNAATVVLYACHLVLYVTMPSLVSITSNRDITRYKQLSRPY